MSGQTLEYSEQDLDDSARAYKRTGLRAPIVLGHPKNDQPVYGWVRSLVSEQGALFADVVQLSNDLVQAVRAGLYKNVSASFHSPSGKYNPAPGVWYLKHVGILGALAPAVKGLGAVSFAEAGPGLAIIQDRISASDNARACQYMNSHGVGYFEALLNVCGTGL